MKAIAVESYGAAPRLFDLADPVPGPGEVLVAIDTASINPLDWRAAEGAFQEFAPGAFPFVLGFDGAGRVAAVGTGASRFRPGEFVHGQFWGDVLGRGTFAELVAISERPVRGALALMPHGVEMRLAAALPTAGMTAHGALAATGCRAGETLLILGATGGVGVLATQLAAQAGIGVLATARRDTESQIRDLGAAEIIDYIEQPVATALAATHPDGVDAVLDLVGNQSQLAEIATYVREGGAIVSIAFGVTDSLAEQGAFTAVNYQLDDKPSRLHQVAAMLAAGQLTVPIHEELDLAHGPAAIGSRRRGSARGKTLIRV